MLNKEQIMEILPHRPPMLLVDEILEMDENHVVGALHLTGDEFFFQGHLTRRNSAQWQSRAIPFVWKSPSPSAAARWQ